MAAAGWVLAVPLACFAVARIAAHDRITLFIWFNAFTFWAFAPTYFALAAAAFARRWVLAGLAGAVIACHLFWVLPDYRPAAGIPAEARAAPHLRLVTANLLYTNTRLPDLIAELEAARPDVLLLQEYSPAAAQLIAQTGLQNELPYFAGIARFDSTGTAILSRYPLRETSAQRSGPPMTSATIDFNGQRVRILTAHPLPPSDRRATARWNRDQTVIASLATNAPDGPVILAGDFNVTQHHRWYGEIVSGRLDDALVKLGMGSSTTWPNGRLLLPRIRIDHVFVSPEVIPLEARIGKGPGSDHRPIIIDLAILPGEQRSARQPSN